MPVPAGTFVQATVTLNTSAAPVTSYNQMFLCDSDDVPIDLRYRVTTRASYSDDLTSTENTYKFATAFWSQSRTARYLYLGRWISAASSPHFICGAHETDYTIWKLISDGTFTVQDNTTPVPLEDDITACDFTSITDINGILTVMNAKLAALSPPNISGLDTAEFAFDINGRLVLTNSTTGEAAKTITIIAQGTGTDLSSATYMDAANGLTIPGYDAEEPTAAVTAILAKNGGDDWYDLAIRGATVSQQSALSVQINAMRRQCTFATDDSNYVSGSDSASIAYIANAASAQRTMSIYTDHSLTGDYGWVDACVQGCVLPAEEGTTNWADERLLSVYESGKDIDDSPMSLTAGVRLIIENKYGNYLVKQGNDTFMRLGKNASGVDKCIVLGADWIANEIESRIATYKLNVPKFSFDNKTLAAIEKYIRQVLAEAYERTIILNSRDYPITVTMPTEADFTAAERASGTMTLSNVFSAYANTSALDVIITGELRI